MAVVTAITIGPVHALAQTTSYALPARAVYLQAMNVIEVSIDGSTFAAVTASTTGTLVTGVFVKCTSGTTQLVCKAS